MGNKYLSEVMDVLSKKSRASELVNEANNTHTMIGTEEVVKDQKKVVKENKSLFQEIYNKSKK